MSYPLIYLEIAAWISFFTFFSCVYEAVRNDQELWRKDMTNEIEIGPADSGYKEIHLRCLDKKRFFQVKTSS